MAEITLGTLYEAHKQLMRTMAPDNESKIKRDLTNVGVWMSTFKDSHYFMLMCKERSDFTLIHLNDYNYSNAIKELKETLESRGTLMGVNYVHGENCYECWVRMQQDGAEPEIFLFMLFEAQWMVVEA